MVDFKISGTWFRWSEIDLQSRWLVAGSLLAAVAGAVPMGLRAIDSVGRRNSANPIPHFEPWMSWITVAALGLAFFLSVLFVRRQDEMFRNANAWATGTASNWTLLIVGLLCCLDMQDERTFKVLFALALCYAVTGSITWALASRKWL